MQTYRKITNLCRYLFPPSLNQSQNFKKEDKISRACTRLEFKLAQLYWHCCNSVASFCFCSTSVIGCRSVPFCPYRWPLDIGRVAVSGGGAPPQVATGSCWGATRFFFFRGVLFWSREIRRVGGNKQSVIFLLLGQSLDKTAGGKFVNSVSISIL